MHASSCAAAPRTEGHQLLTGCQWSRAVSCWACSSRGRRSARVPPKTCITHGPPVGAGATLGNRSTESDGTFFATRLNECCHRPSAVRTDALQTFDHAALIRLRLVLADLPLAHQTGDRNLDADDGLC